MSLKGRYQMYFPCGKAEQHESIFEACAKGRCPVNHPVGDVSESAK